MSPELAEELAKQTAPVTDEESVEDDGSIINPEEHCGDVDWWSSRTEGDPGSYVEACGEYPPWLDDGCNEYGCFPDHEYPRYSCDMGEDGVPICEGDVPESVGDYNTPSYYESSGEAQYDHLCNRPDPAEGC